MNNNPPSPHSDLLKAYEHRDFQTAVLDALDWVPELKHEGVVCTHLSSTLRKLGVDSRREVTVGKRRYDIKIRDVFVEAKYHFEGDLHPVLNALKPDNGFAYNPKGWNSAPKSIHDELNRGEPSSFLWLVCVRCNPDDQIKYPKLIQDFYKAAELKVQDLPHFIEAAESIMDGPILEQFKNKMLTAEMHALPTLRGNHSALISRLYTLAPNALGTNDAGINNQVHHFHTSHSPARANGEPILHADVV